MRQCLARVLIAALCWLVPTIEARANGALDRALTDGAPDPTPPLTTPVTSEWGADIVSGVCGLAVGEVVGKLGGEAGFGLRLAGAAVGTVVCHYADKSVTAVLIPEPQPLTPDLRRRLLEHRSSNFYVVAVPTARGGPATPVVPLGGAITEPVQTPRHGLRDLLEAPDNAPPATATGAEAATPDLFAPGRNGGPLATSDTDPNGLAGGTASEPAAGDLHLDPATIERLVHASAGRPISLATVPLTSILPADTTKQ